jgi:hypothetical protein
MTDKQKAIRKLSDFDFEREGASVSLVGPSVGGAANGRKTLVTKSTHNIDKEHVEKASQVTVTMNIVDYLYRFFDLWYEDAVVLARIFGYDTTPDEVETNDNWYDNYIQEKVDAVSIMKSLVVDKSPDEVKKAVSELSPQDYLKVIKSQEIFEQNFDKVKADIKKSSDKQTEGVTESNKDSISPNVDTIKNKEDLMSEFISKSAHDSKVKEEIEKALSPLKTKLEQAEEIIKQFETAKKEAVAKARQEKIATVEKDAEAAKELFTSLESVSDDVFESIVKALKRKDDQLNNSEILKEVGGQGRQVVTDEVEDVTAKILKQKFQGK